MRDEATRISFIHFLSAVPIPYSLKFVSLPKNHIILNVLSKGEGEGEGQEEQKQQLSKHKTSDTKERKKEEDSASPESVSTKKIEVFHDEIDE